MENNSPIKSFMDNSVHNMMNAAEEKKVPGFSIQVDWNPETEIVHISEENSSGCSYSLGRIMNTSLPYYISQCVKQYINQEVLCHERKDNSEE